jgi:hypothetical protein
MTPRFPVRNACALAAAFSLLALASACVDRATAPMGTSPAVARPSGPSMSKGPGTAQQKYSDKGTKPATAVYQGISVATRASLLRNGTTVFELVAGDFEGPQAGRGTLWKARFEIFDLKGHKIKIDKDDQDVDLKYNWKSGVPSARFTLRGVGKDFRVDVKTTASGTNPKTRHDFQLSTTVKSAPDLAIIRTDVPNRIHAVEVVNVSATVRELNGDMGGRADCVLYADGLEVDRAANVWVDAGDQVSCAFATRFTSLGRKTLRVAVENGAPTDFDSGNDTASTIVSVEPLPLQLAYTASAFQHTGKALSDYTYQYDDDPITGFGYHSTYTQNHSLDEQVQYARIFASAPQTVSFPIDSIQLSQSTDGTLIDSRSYTALAGGATFGTKSDGGTCAQTGDQGYSVIICAYHRDAATWTTVYYQHYAGVVTYISRELATYTAPWGSGQYPPGYYESNSAWGSFTPFGSSVTMSVKVTSGLYSLVASPTISLTENSYGSDSNPCTTELLPNGQAKQCYDLHGRYKDKEGFVVKDQ